MELRYSIRLQTTFIYESDPVEKFVGNPLLPPDLVPFMLLF